MINKQIKCLNTSRRLAIEKLVFKEFASNRITNLWQITEDIKWKEPSQAMWTILRNIHIIL